MTVAYDSAAAIARAVREGDLRASDAVDRALAAIAGDPHFAFVDARGDAARREAEAVDARRARGLPLGPLAGVPVARKDNLLLEGERTACGSRMLESFVAPCTATVLRRLQAADAVLVGRTNMDEFGMGSSTERSAFGPTANPWDRTRVPGGSSGGAAAAVAAGLVPLAVGSDTGGSVRQPAALCGVTGFKPSYGRISRSGLVAYASSLDCVGLIARTVEDAALGLCAAGEDGEDPTSRAEPTPTFDAANAPPRLDGMRVLVVDEWLADGIEPEVERAFTASLATLRELGAELVRGALPHTRHAVAAYYLIACAEASSNLARYDGVRYGLPGSGRTFDAAVADARTRGFGPEVQLRILLGTHALRHGYHDAWYGKATRVRERIRRDFATQFARADFVVAPTSPIAAFPRGARTEDPLAMYRADALTVPASLAGLPAVSVPCGFTANGLPIGLQWIGPEGADVRVLAAAHAFQRATDWHLRRPGS